MSTIVDELIQRMDAYFLDTGSIFYVCICGELLARTDARVYGPRMMVLCDLCGESCKDCDYVYHCPQKRTKVHSHGFDTCKLCIESSPNGAGRAKILRAQGPNIYIHSPIFDNESVCFCGNVLEEMQRSRKHGQCKCCCRTLDQHDAIVYKCCNTKCIYRTVATNSEYSYYECAQCFQEFEMVHYQPQQMDETALMRDKFESCWKRISQQITQYASLLDKQQYIVEVFDCLYLIWLAKLQSTPFGASHHYHHTHTKFDEIYADMVSEIPKETDHAELGIESSIAVVDTHTHADVDASPANTVDLDQIHIEWQTISIDAQKTQIFELEDSECNTLSQCLPSKRIQFVMELYRKHFLSECIYPQLTASSTVSTASSAAAASTDFVYTFQAALTNYNQIDLVNDFQHIKSTHLPQHRAHYRDCQYAVHDIAVDTGDESACDEECGCDSILRQERETRYNASESENASPTNNLEAAHSVPSISLMEVSADIHIALNHRKYMASATEHEHDDEASFRLRALKWRKHATDNKWSKFINDVETSQVKHSSHKASMDDLTDVLAKHGMVSADIAQFRDSFLAEHEYDTDAVYEDLEHASHSNIICTALPAMASENTQLVGALQKQFAANESVFKIAEFQFGTSCFKHWPYFAHHSTRYIAAPKYASLKEESLQNEIYSMELETWQLLLHKAYVLKHSLRCKQLVAQNYLHDNYMYSVPVRAPISIAHVLSLLCYTNCTKQQYFYKKYGCRELKANHDAKGDDETQLLQRHRQIAHWYKLLFEAVLIFGRMVRPKQRFYTGMNVKLAFTTLVPVFCCPVSTTAQWSVAHRFSDDRGIVIEMTPESNNCWDKYFDVSWMSNYPEEDERLFVKINALQIANVQCFDDPVAADAREQNCNYDNRLCIAALKLWSALFNGRYVFCNSVAAPNVQRMLVTLVQTYCVHGAGDQNMPSMYIRQLFYAVANRLSTKAKRRWPILIIESQHKKLLPELQKLLVSFDYALENDAEYQNIDSESCVFKQCIKSLIGSYEFFPNEKRLLHSILCNLYYITWRLEWRHSQSIYADDPWSKPIFESDLAMRFLEHLGYQYKHEKKKLKCVHQASLFAIASAKRAFSVYHPNHMTLSPFLHQLDLQPINIDKMQEFEWEFSPSELQKLKSAKADEWIECDEAMQYVFSDGNNLTFHLSMCRAVVGTKYAGLRIDRSWLSNCTRTLKEGTFSVMVEQLEWVKNEEPLKNVSHDYAHTILVFEDKLLASPTALTLELAIHFSD